MAENAFRPVDWRPRVSDGEARPRSGAFKCAECDAIWRTKEQRDRCCTATPPEATAPALADLKAALEGLRRTYRHEWERRSRVAHDEGAEQIALKGVLYAAERAGLLSEEEPKDRLSTATHHATPKCDHRFVGWRAFEGGNGGEQVCAKCGIGAMEWTMRSGL